jgi:sulfate permease, SulP family
VISEIARSPKVFILRMRNVPAIDATGIYALERLAKKCRHDGTTLILAEIREQPLRAIVRARKLELFGGRKNLAKTLDIALDRARQVLSGAGAATPPSPADQREKREQAAGARGSGL